MHLGKSPDSDLNSPVFYSSFSVEDGRLDDTYVKMGHDGGEDDLQLPNRNGRGNTQSFIDHKRKKKPTPSPLDVDLIGRIARQKQDLIRIVHGDFADSQRDKIRSRLNESKTTATVYCED